MSDKAVEQRPSTDIFYDHDPFIRGEQVRYIQADQKLAGIRDFSVIPEGYNVLLWEGIRNDNYFRESINNSYFLRDFLGEILNRLCHECSKVVDIELHPHSYKHITKESLIKPIGNWFSYAIETCRYGDRNERMIDSITREDIDIFLEKIVDFAADRLMIYIINAEI